MSAAHPKPERRAKRQSAVATVRRRTSPAKRRPVHVPPPFRRRTSRGKTSRRTTTAVGRVVRDEDGAPLAGVRVRLVMHPFGEVAPPGLEPRTSHCCERHAAAWREALARRLPEATTGADGRFLLRGVPRSAPRSLNPTVEFVHPGRVRKLLGFQWSRADARAPSVTIRMGPGRRVEGRVRRGRGVAAGGRIVVGAARLRPEWPPDHHPCTLETHLDPRAGWFRMEAAQQAAVGVDGRFAFDGLDATSDVHLGARDGRGDPLVPTVRLAAGTAPARIELRVRGIEPLRVRALGPDGRPVAGARLHGRGSDRGRPGVRTDAAGIAEEIPSWSPDDRATLLVEKPGFASATVAPRPGRRAKSPVDVHLQTTVAVRGRVTDSAGRPIARAAVELWPWSGLCAGDVLRSYVTAPDGTFAGREFSPGEWQLSAQRRGFILATRRIVLPGDDASLRLLRAATALLRLVPPRGRRVPSPVCVMVGTSIDWEGDPRDGGASRSGIPAWRRPGAGGRLVVPGVAPGRHEIALWAPGFEPSSVPLDVVEGATADLGDVVLVPTDRGDAATPDWARPSRRPGAGT